MKKLKHVTHHWDVILSTIYKLTQTTLWIIWHKIPIINVWKLYLVLKVIQSHHVNKECDLTTSSYTQAEVVSRNSRNFKKKLSPDKELPCKE